MNRATSRVVGEIGVERANERATKEGSKILHPTDGPGTVDGCRSPPCRTPEVRHTYGMPSQSRRRLMLGHCWASIIIRQIFPFPNLATTSVRPYRFRQRRGSGRNDPAHPIPPSLSFRPSVAPLDPLHTLHGGLTEGASGSNLLDSSR